MAQMKIVDETVIGLGVMRIYYQLCAPMDDCPPDLTLFHFVLIHPEEKQEYNASIILSPCEFETPEQLDMMLNGLTTNIKRDYSQVPVYAEQVINQFIPWMRANREQVHEYVKAHPVIVERRRKYH